MPDRRFLPLAALSGIILGVAGCQSGDSAGALAVGDGAKPAEQKVTEAELRAYCPRVTLRDGTAYFNNYAKGGDGDATKVVHQASIGEVTRTCTTSADGAMTMNVAVAGRVVPGPAFSPGSINMPIRIVVTHGDDVLYSQLHRHQVSVSDGSAATQFVFNDPNVSFVLPADRRVQVFAGYDEGPPKRQ
ncbi:hypothetical protein [Arvimicrobium flavum]|uniref:hypothetical protein n=1 Tax=Arvimicrobium flavum TaxID=3393320 RepID=UPI0030841B74